jgi:hypothetical protein
MASKSSVFLTGANRDRGTRIAVRAIKDGNGRSHRCLQLINGVSSPDRVGRSFSDCESSEVPNRKSPFAQHLSDRRQMEPKIIGIKEFDVVRYPGM